MAMVIPLAEVGVTQVHQRVPRSGDHKALDQVGVDELVGERLVVFCGTPAGT